MTGDARAKVLVVDDEPDNVRLVERALRKQYDVLSFTSGQEALEFLKTEQDIALILTDQRMPGISGVRLLEESLKTCPFAVRVILTGYSDVQDILDAINVGHVSRFVLKPVDPDRLVSIIKDSLEVYFLTRERNFLLSELERRNRRLEEHEKELERLVVDRTQQLEVRNEELRSSVAQLNTANARLSELALRDGLTGLYNHRYFQERLQAEVGRARRHNGSLSLLFADVDHFKAFNDRYGHPAGDELLRSLAQILLEGSRISDVVARVRTAEVVARYGGEEFGVILPETGREGALLCAERVRAWVSRSPFAGANGEPRHVTVSIGVASYPVDAVDAPSLIRRADRALYRAKEDGRDRVFALEGPAETE